MTGRNPTAEKTAAWRSPQASSTKPRPGAGGCARRRRGCGTSRDDLTELGESLDNGEASLVVVGVMDTEARIEESTRHLRSFRRSSSRGTSRPSNLTRGRHRSV